MASLDILCFNSFNLKNKIMEIEHKKRFCGPSKSLKSISWPINICLKYFMASTKTLRSPSSYILNVRSITRKKFHTEKKKGWSFCVKLFSRYCKPRFPCFKKQIFKFHTEKKKGWSFCVKFFSRYCKPRFPCFKKQIFNEISTPGSQTL